MNIDGLGEKIVDQLIEKNLVKDYADIYKLDLESLSNLDRMAEKSAQNLLDEIAASKKNSLERLIYGIGIPFVGERTAQLLARHFGSMEKLASASTDELLEVAGNETRRSPNIFLRVRQPQTIDNLRAVGVNMKEDRPAPKGTQFAGKTFVFTGTL